MANYVKFIRGLTSIFNKLQNKDDDTLYFIYDDETATSGRLYLGDKEIICHSGKDSGVAYLKDLLDVQLPENIGELIDGQVLTYDVATESWVARDPSTVATVLFDENQFTVNENGEWSLLDFANAPNGARLTKGSNGKLIWDLPDDVTVEDVSERLELLEASLENYDTAAEVDSKIASALAAANHLSYKTVGSVDEIDLTESQYIYLVKNGEIYDEYMVIDGRLEKVGDWNVDLSSYATKIEVQAVDTKVEDLTSLLNGVSSSVTTIGNNLANITTRVESLENATSQVTDLATQLNNLKIKVEAAESTIENHGALIVELQEALADKVDKEDFDEFRNAMSWTNLSDDNE